MVNNDWSTSNKFLTLVSKLMPSNVKVDYLTLQCDVLSDVNGAKYIRSNFKSSQMSLPVRDEGERACCSPSLSRFQRHLSAVSLVLSGRQMRERGETRSRRGKNGVNHPVNTES